MNFLVSLPILILFIRILALIVASFLFWRRLKEDFPTEEIFVLNILLLIVSLIAISLWSFQGAFLSLVTLLIFFSNYKKWNPWQVADALIFPFLLLIFAIYLSTFLLEYNSFFGWFNLSVAILSLLVIIFTLLMEKKYRSLSWYLSGKVGFLACISTIAFFSLFLLLELFFKKALYLTILTDIVIIVLAAFLLYHRAERNWQADKQYYLKFFKKNDR